MSMEAYKWAKTWRLAPADKAVLMTIADYYNDEQHRAWPGKATLAKDTGYSLATVKRALRSLEEQGLIVKEPWVKVDEASDKRNESNRYCLPMYDALSIRAATVPVIVHKYYGNDGQVVYDTLAHRLAHGEEVASYGVPASAKAGGQAHAQAPRPIG